MSHVIHTLTIPHTGTRTLWKVLERLGVEDHPGFHLRNGMDRSVYQARRREPRVASVARHPVDVALGAMKRLERVEVSMYDALYRLDQTHPDFHIVQIDGDLDAELEALCEWIGCDVPESFEWPNEGYEEPWFEVDRSELAKRLCGKISAPTHKWLRERFGYNLRGDV